LLLDVTWAGTSLIAVGQWGNVLRSKDGHHWQQPLVPTTATLTRVRFFDAQHGWAIGYDGTVLASIDGGQSWRLEHFDAAWGKPYFDVRFLDLDNGFLAGANGVLMRTADGGKTWDTITSPALADSPNLYNLLPLGDGCLLLVGERGFLALSSDHGGTWTQLKSPYSGSYFGAAAVGGTGALVFGLRGNAFYTANVRKLPALSPKELDAQHTATDGVADTNQSSSPVRDVAGWIHLKNDDDEPLFGSAAGADGSVYLVGQNGDVKLFRSSVPALMPIDVSPHVNMNAAALDGSTLITVGTSGLVALALPK